MFLPVSNLDTVVARANNFYRRRDMRLQWDPAFAASVESIRTFTTGGKLLISRALAKRREEYRVRNFNKSF